MERHIIFFTTFSAVSFGAVILFIFIKFFKKATSFNYVNLYKGYFFVLLTEAGRIYYRPYIHVNNIQDFHIADTIGNSLGSIAIVCFAFSVLELPEKKGKVAAYATLIIAGLILYELSGFLFNHPVDIFDIAATVVAGIYMTIFELLLYAKIKLRVTDTYKENLNKE